ncbi:adaptation of rhodopsin mediated signaling [Desmophyllum pertusum]|uniref:Adaptation of rhodopsin mediated signaling n=1 Tax=Desmophyllum pertusum TaxID=174260 RepID=A0A9X0D069_9CNID|nr:adaptation of rhodopsin mediated signaling [Desmophyllum pertusum]
MPVGVEDGRIPDEAFTASSSDSAGFLPNRARLNLHPSGKKYCWAAGKNNVNQWLQVNLGRLFQRKRRGHPRASEGREKLSPTPKKRRKKLEAHAVVVEASLLKSLQVRRK